MTQQPQKQELAIFKKLASTELVAELKKALPMTVNIGPEQFARTCITLLRKNPKIAECTPASILGGVMTAAQLGLSLEPSLGQAYLNPYWNGKIKGKEAQFIIGYKGYIQLGYRGGMKSIQGFAVFEGDDFEFERGLDEKLIHRPLGCDRSNPDKLVAVYAIGTLPSGQKIWDVMNQSEIAAIRERTKSRNQDGAITGPWVADFIPMAIKSVVRRLAKWFPTYETSMGDFSDNSVVRVNPENFQPASETHEWEDEGPLPNDPDSQLPGIPMGPAAPNNPPVETAKVYMNEAQRKKMYAILNQLAKGGQIDSVDVAKQQIYANYQVESLNDLTVAQAAEVIGQLEKMTGDPSYEGGAGQ